MIILTRKFTFLTFIANSKCNLYIMLTKASQIIVSIISVQRWSTMVETVRLIACS